MGWNRMGWAGLGWDSVETGDREERREEKKSEEAAPELEDVVGSILIAVGCGWLEEQLFWQHAL
eukprot:3685277-Rhodomonas_salina.4